MDTPPPGLAITPDAIPSNRWARLDDQVPDLYSGTEGLLTGMTHWGGTARDNTDYG